MSELKKNRTFFKMRNPYYLHFVIFRIFFLGETFFPTIINNAVHCKATAHAP